MGRFDRYVLSQLILVFGFFALVLVGVYWINRAVLLVDQFMGAGQPGRMVLELTLLTLPSLVKLVLPIAAFLAVLQVTNRLYGESELVVVQATGFSGWRLARPVLMFGCVVAVLIAILAHVLVPASMARLNAKEAELAEAAASRLLVPGAFQDPIDGVTVYVREVRDNGELRDMLLSDRRDPELETTYTAQRAYLIQDDDGPKLLMFDGIAQTWDRPRDRLSTTRYTDFTFSLADMIRPPQSQRLDPRQVGTWALLTPTVALQEATRRNPARLVRDGHVRIAESTLTPALCVMGFAALMLGTFNRFGLWRQLVLATFLVVVVKLADNAAADVARSGPGAWPIVYAPTALAGGFAIALLTIGNSRIGRGLARLPALWRRRAGERAA